MKNYNYLELTDKNFPPASVTVMLNVAKKSIIDSANNCNNSLSKKMFDIILSLIIFIMVFSWLFPLIVLLIKLTSKGPAFYTQVRIGLNGKMIRMYKFRTMVKDAPILDESGKFIQSVKNDSRITWIGKFLRKTSMDELPQFINVLMGDMSIIGPRPLVEHMLALFDEPIENYELRTLVKPGITGLSQIKGLRGFTKGADDMRNRVSIDIEYIRKWNFWLDMQIFFGTIYVMLVGDKNAY